MNKTELWELETRLAHCHNELARCLALIEKYQNFPCKLAPNMQQALEIAINNQDWLTSELHAARKAYAKALIAACPQITE